jgi:hypothetical protein
MNLNEDARYAHDMIFQPNLAIIIIYGGRNENLINDGFLDDMHILKLDTNVWQ